MHLPDTGVDQFNLGATGQEAVEPRVRGDPDDVTVDHEILCADVPPADGPHVVAIIGPGHCEQAQSLGDDVDPVRADRDIEDRCAPFADRCDRRHYPHAADQRDAAACVADPDRVVPVDLHIREIVGRQAVGDRQMLELPAVETVEAALCREPEVTGTILFDVVDLGLGQAVSNGIEPEREFSGAGGGVRTERRQRSQDRGQDCGVQKARLHSTNSLDSKT